MLGTTIFHRIAVISLILLIPYNFDLKITNIYTSAQYTKSEI
jgi:hypothetical protein